MEHGSINQIDKSSVHKICSGQVVLDLATSVKELVENALDADATSIEVCVFYQAFFGNMVASSIYSTMKSVQIRLKEYGLELIEVADNGSGIRQQDYEAVAAKYHTSKISSFEDVHSVDSFGFRGEALSSLCAVAQLSINTRVASQTVGNRLTFDHHGTLTGARARTSRERMCSVGPSLCEDPGSPCVESVHLCNKRAHDCKQELIASIHMKLPAYLGTKGHLMHLKFKGTISVAFRCL
jgi:DNA mismatch repair protein PMS2